MKPLLRFLLLHTGIAWIRALWIDGGQSEKKIRAWRRYLDSRLS